MPCTRIEKAVMAKSILKISGTLTERATLDGGDIVILADPNAKLTPTQDGAALEIRNSKVKIYDLEISHMATGSPKDGIFVNDDRAVVELTHVSIINNTNDGARINAGHFSCVRCTIAQNTQRGINLSSGVIAISRSVIQGNANGGILIGANGIFQIVANFIFGNGGPSSVTGGINAPALDGDSSNRIDFNSISHNNAMGAAAGIQCISGTAFTARYNIIWKNGTSPTFPADQVNAGGCAHVLSDIGPFPAVPTASNFNVDPGFVDETNGDLRLKSDSRVLTKVEAPDLSGLAAFDIDGEMRVGATDLGADQVSHP